MDPLSICLASYTAIKAGVKAGREIQDLAGEIGKLFDGIDAIKGEHSKKKNKSFGKGVNEEALETFVANQKAKDIEDELRTIIIYTRGMNAWQELLRLRGQIKRERQEAEKAQRARREQIKEYILAAFLIVAASLLLIWFVWFVYTAKKGEFAYDPRDARPLAYSTQDNFILPIGYDMACNRMVYRPGKSQHEPGGITIGDDCDTYWGLWALPGERQDGSPTTSPENKRISF